MNQKEAEQEDVAVQDGVMAQGASRAPAKSVAVINMKGGVGKTTLSFNLSAELARRGSRVLLVDLDPQGNATLVCMGEDERKAHSKSKKTITSLFIDAFEPRVPVVGKGVAEIDLSSYTFSVGVSGIAAGGALDFVPSDIYLSSVLRGVSLGPYTLDKLLNEHVRMKYDYIIVDCAPTYSALTTIALNSCGAVLIPMISDSFGKHGTDLMKQILDEHRHDFGVDVAVVGVVFTMKQDNSNHRSTVNEIVRKWGPESVFKAGISKNEWYKVANGQRIPFSQSQAHSEPKAELASFVEEFIRRAQK